MNAGEQNELEVPKGNQPPANEQKAEKPLVESRSNAETQEEDNGASVWESEEEQAKRERMFTRRDFIRMAWTAPVIVAVNVAWPSGKAYAQSSHFDYVDHADHDDHVDQGHTDAHTDNHTDWHIDAPLHLDHTDGGHWDFHTDWHGDIPHEDSYTDSPHTDSSHLDHNDHQDHQDAALGAITPNAIHTDHDDHDDSPHLDTLHQDIHQDFHIDDPNENRPDQRFSNEAFHEDHLDHDDSHGDNHQDHGDWGRYPRQNRHVDISSHDDHLDHIDG